MYPSVKHVTPLENYVLMVEFDNGESGALDMTPYLDFGVFNQLKDPNLFRLAHVSFDTVAWNSQLDLDPEFVYCHCINAGADRQSARV